MLRAEGRFLDRDAPFVQLLGLLVVRVFELRDGQIVEALRGLGMVGPERLLAQLERAAMELDRLVEVSLGTVQLGEIGQRGGERRVRGAEFLLLDLERALVQRPGLVVEPLCVLEGGQVVAGFRSRQMIVAVRRDAHGERPLIQRLGRVVAPLGGVQHRQIVERLGHVRIAPEDWNTASRTKREQCGEKSGERKTQRDARSQ